MEQIPLITIGITAFNAISTIEKALMSALGQTWKSFEIVIVDDASTDGTFEKLNNLKIEYPYLRIFCNKINSGVSVSRNRIVKEARGDFIAFFDDDDESCPERLEEQYKRIIDYETLFADGAPVVCHTARDVFYPNGKRRMHETIGENENMRCPAGVAVARRILIGEPLKGAYGSVATCSQMARTSTYFLVGGFDPELRRGEDTDFCIRFSLLGGHFIGVSKPLVRQFMTKTVEKSLEDEYRNTRKILMKYQNIIEDNGNFDFCLNWLEFKYAYLRKERLNLILILFKLLTTYPFLSFKRFFLALKNHDINKNFSDFHKIN